MLQHIGEDVGQPRRRERETCPRRRSTGAARRSPARRSPRRGRPRPGRRPQLVLSRAPSTHSVHRRSTRSGPQDRAGRAQPGRASRRRSGERRGRSAASPRASPAAAAPSRSEPSPTSRPPGRRSPARGRSSCAGPRDRESQMSARAPRTVTGRWNRMYSPPIRRGNSAPFLSSGVRTRPSRSTVWKSLVVARTARAPGPERRVQIAHVLDLVDPRDPRILHAPGVLRRSGVGPMSGSSATTQFDRRSATGRP